VGCVAKSPTVQFELDRVVMDFGPNVHVVVRGRSVSMADPDNRFITVGTPRSGGAPGLTFQAADGSGGVVQEGVVSWFAAKSGTANTILQFTPSAAEVRQADGGGTMLKLSEGTCHTLGKVNKVQGAGVYLGANPTETNTVIYGQSGQTGVPSLSVFVSK